MTVSVGVLGLGSIGSRHATNLRALGCQVIGFDPSADQRHRFQSAGGIVAAGREELFGSVQAVVVATPSHCHLADLTEAVARGVHAFVEKPLAHTDGGLEAVLDEAEVRRLAVFAGLNLRFHPAAIAARRLLATGSLGRPLWARLIAASYLPAWRPQQDYRTNYAAAPGSGGALFDFIHEFDLACHLLGPAQALAGTARRSGTLDIPTEDIGDAVLAHACGAHSAIHVDYVTRPRQRLVEVGGTDGVMTIDLEHWTLEARGVDGSLIADHAWEPRPNDMYLAEMTAFLRCLDGEPPACDGREALDVLRTVLEVRRLAGLT